MKEMPTQELPPDSFYEYVPDSDSWIVKKKSGNKVLSKRDIVGYEGGWPSQEDAVYWGTAAPNTYSDEPLINHDYPKGSRERDDEQSISICPQCKSQNIDKRSNPAKCQDCGVDFMPKPDRGSDDPTANDYSQNYFWGPNDLGRSHQNQPGANGWLPAGTEDMDGPSSNVRMSSLEKKADIGNYWIDPTGKEYKIPGTHTAWVGRNAEKLNKKFAYNLPIGLKEGHQYTDMLIDLGWVRITGTPGNAQFVIDVKDVNNIPSVVDDFIARHFQTFYKPPMPIWVGSKGHNIVIVDDPFPNIQQAVNKVLSQSKMSSFTSFMQKQSSLNKIYTREQLERMDIDDLDRMAYGHASGDIIKLNPAQIHIQYPVDLSNPEYKFEQKGMDWVKSVDLSEPIKVRIKQDGKFYLEDGHHRWFAAKKLGLPVNAEIEVYAKPIETILQRQNKISSLNKFAHCGPCAVIKAEVIKMLSDLKYKDNSVKAEDLENLALYSSEPSNDDFIQYLGEIIEALPKEHNKEIQKLQNHKFALEDIQKRIDDGDMVVDKPTSKESSLKQADDRGSKPVTQFDPEYEFFIKLVQLVIKAGVPVQEIQALGEKYPSTTVDDIGDMAAKVWTLATEKYHIPREWLIKRLPKNASLNKQANPSTRYWISPEGKEFDAGTNHGAWINLNKDLLKQYGINISTIGYAWDSLLNNNWVRVSNEPAGSGFQIQVKDLKHLPSFLDNFVAQHFNNKDMIEVGDQSGNLVRIYDPFPSLQKAVNRALSLKQTASHNSKTASLIDEVLDQTTQDAIAAEYGPDILIALRFYNDGVRYGQNPQRSMEYALEEMNRMHRPVDRKNFLEVLDTYF